LVFIGSEVPMLSFFSPWLNASLLGLLAVLSFTSINMAVAWAKMPPSRTVPSATKAKLTANKRLSVQGAGGFVLPLNPDLDAAPQQASLGSLRQGMQGGKPPAKEGDAPKKRAGSTYKR
jgi:hypothetical protein